MIEKSKLKSVRNTLINLIPFILKILIWSFLFIGLSTAYSWLFTQTNTNNPFVINNWAIAVIWIVQILILALAIFVSYKHYNFWMSGFANMIIVMFVPMLYSLSSYRSNFNVGQFEHFLQQAQYHYWTFIGALIAFLVITIWQYTSLIKSNYWYMFIIVIIVMALGSIAYRDLSALIRASNSSHLTVGSMLVLNDLYHDINNVDTSRNLVTVVFNGSGLFLIGGVIYEFMDKKFKKFQKGKEIC